MPLTLLQSRGESVALPEGSTVFDYGEPANYLFIVSDGCVKIFSLLPDGRRQIFGFLFPGDFLGISINDHYAYSAVCSTPATLQRFRKRDFERLCAESSALARHALYTMTNELVVAQDQILLLGRRTAAEKVASFLLMLQKRAKTFRDGDDAMFLPMSRADMADYLGLSSETISRVLGQMERRGIIEKRGRNHVTLTDPDVLEDIVTDGGEDHAFN